MARFGNLMDKQFAAAIEVLSADLLWSMVSHAVDFEREKIDVYALLEESRPWSHGQQLMLEAAIALFHGSSTIDDRQLARLGDLVTTLDNGNLRVVLNAVRIARGWPRVETQG